MKTLFQIFTIIVFLIAIHSLYFSEPNYVYSRDVSEVTMNEPNESEREKIRARNIEYDNIYYKDRIFGNPFNGLAISIEPTKEEYEIGENIEISILYKNFSQEELVFMRDRYFGNKEDCAYIMYFPDGTPVPKSEVIEEYEANINKPLELPRYTSNEIMRLRPGMIRSYKQEIDRYLKIEKEGTYSLIIIRNMNGSWKDGFMVSNMTKIKIVKKKEEQN